MEGGIAIHNGLAALTLVLTCDIFYGLFQVLQNGIVTMLSEKVNATIRLRESLKLTALYRTGICLNILLILMFRMTRSHMSVKRHFVKKSMLANRTDMSKISLMF